VADHELKAQYETKTIRELQMAGARINRQIQNTMQVILEERFDSAGIGFIACLANVIGAVQWQEYFHSRILLDACTKFAGPPFASVSLGKSTQSSHIPNTFI
jgi:hypothetical protein